MGEIKAIDFSETFYDLTKTVATTGTLTLGKQSTVTIDGNLTLSGTAGNLLGIKSSTNGTRHTWDITVAEETVSFLDVRDSQASTNSIRATFSTSLSNNDDGEGAPFWIFGQGPLRGAIMIVD